MLQRELCTGCGACAALCIGRCITMAQDERGFAYPKIEESRCTGCGLCESVCPVRRRNTAAAEEAPLPEAVAGAVKNSSIKAQSSSGGIFTALAEQVLDRQGIVFGAAFLADLSVAHIAAENSETLSKLRGSKYVESDASACYAQVKKALQAGRQVLFSGTPCQNEALAAYLGKAYENLLLVDFICHGAPSPLVWKEYLHWQEQKHHSKPVKANFRNKTDGWDRFSLSLRFADGTEYRERFDRDCYMRAFLKNLSLRDSCYRCSFKTMNRCSDLTLSDYWGINKISPEKNDNTGVSAVYIQSEKGRKALMPLIEQALLWPIDAQTAADNNKGMTRSAYIRPLRAYFFSELGKQDFESLVNAALRPQA